MRRRILLAFALVLCAIPWSATRAQEPPAAPYQLAVVTDRPEALYAVGDKVTFRITLTKEGQPVEGEVACQTDKDGMPPVNRGTLKLEAGAAFVEGTLAEPGFPLCRVTYTGPEKQVVRAMAGAGFDPTPAARHRVPHRPAGIERQGPGRQGEQPGRRAVPQAYRRANGCSARRKSRFVAICS